MCLLQKDKEYIYAGNLLIVVVLLLVQLKLLLILCSFYPFSQQYVPPALLGATVGDFTLGLASQRVPASVVLCWDGMSMLMVSSPSPLRVNFICLLTRFYTFSFLHWSSAPRRILIYYMWCPLCMLDTISEYLKCRKQRRYSLGYTRNQFCPGLALHFFNCPWVSCVQAVACPMPACAHLLLSVAWPKLHPGSPLPKASAIVEGLDFSNHQYVSDKYLVLPRITACNCCPYKTTVVPYKYKQK